MLVMMELCKLMTKHGIKPSFSKRQHTRVTKNGLDNIRGTRQCMGIWYFLILLYFPCRHVQVSNDEALEFYQKSGFSIVDTKEQYYKRIDPPHAFVLQRDLKGPLGPIDS